MTDLHYIQYNWNSMHTVPINVPVRIACAGRDLICLGIGIVSQPENIYVKDIEWQELVYTSPKYVGENWRGTYWTYVTLPSMTLKLDL